jgi:hypothetical protein
MDTLETIAQLREALRADATSKQADAWWDLYSRLETDFEVFDKRTSKHERSLLNQLKDGLSHVTRMLQEGHPEPDVHPALVALRALEGSIQRRTIGPDGWPLKG